MHHFMGDLFVIVSLLMKFFCKYNKVLLVVLTRSEIALYEANQLVTAGNAITTYRTPCFEFLL